MSLNLGPFPTTAEIVAAITATSHSVTVLSPLLPDGHLEIVRGDDYLSTAGRALNFAFTGVQSLAGAAVTFVIASTFDASSFTIVGTAPSPTSVMVELAAGITSQLFIGESAYEYAVNATLADGSAVTLQIGTVSVIE